jgi:ubiquinone/menaquinone biosynthesis C-methylase UbiE
MNRQEFYRQVYQEMKAGWKDSLRLYQEMVSDNIGSDSYVIDIGCGHADFLGVVYARAGNVYGIDPDLQALKNNMTIQQVVNGMADNIPFKDEYFDVVTCAWVLEHLENPEDVFNEIYRILKPGGKLIFLTPNALNYNVWIIRMIPNKLHSFFTRILYHRQENDTYPVVYKANSPKKVNSLLSMTGFSKNQLVLNGDPSYISLNSYMFKLAYFIETIIDKWLATTARVHLLGIYRK